MGKTDNSDAKSALQTIREVHNDRKGETHDPVSHFVFFVAEEKVTWKESPEFAVLFRVTFSFFLTNFHCSMRAKVCKPLRTALLLDFVHCSDMYSFSPNFVHFTVFSSALSHFSSHRAVEEEEAATPQAQEKEGKEVKGVCHLNAGEMG